MTGEELRALRNARKIRVSGAEAPAILPDLAALASVPGCPQQLIENIGALGWTSLTETQMQSIPTLLDDRDVLSCAPTGSGKTGAFAIPLLVRLLRGAARPGADASPRAIILAPTRELATQIARETARLAKDTGISVRALAKEDDASVFAECDVLVSTPLRLATLVTAQPGRRLAAVEMLVVRLTNCELFILATLLRRNRSEEREMMITTSILGHLSKGSRSGRGIRSSASLMLTTSLYA